ncbi:hypothetical protein WN55_04180 [Dufourea novaeangliae]|uniref:Uncharacterized protein n=1 Tax=Dufourea novaeangliae TaxID=178035 RepID=A0A154PKE1_DUFNO|nr:hypothetical protein WN55_04180 [Dufourea novaeangliae]
MQVMSTVHAESPRGAADEGDFSRRHPVPASEHSGSVVHWLRLFTVPDATPCRYHRGEPINGVVVPRRRTADRP